MPRLKARLPGSYADAVTRIMGALTPEGAAKAVGKTPGLVRGWSDPDSDSLPSIAQAEKLDAAYVAATGEAGPLGALLRQRTRRGLRRAAHVALDPHARLSEIVAEVGEIGLDLTKALRDRHLSPNEIARLAKDARDAKKAIDRFLADLAARVQGGAA
jgi:hypothetical protein